MIMSSEVYAWRDPGPLFPHLGAAELERSEAYLDWVERRKVPSSIDLFAHVLKTIVTQGRFDRDLQRVTLTEIAHEFGYRPLISAPQDKWRAIADRVQTVFGRSAAS